MTDIRYRGRPRSPVDVELIRSCAVARHVNCLPYTAVDLAADLGVSEATVKRRLSLAGIGLLTLVRERDVDTGPMTATRTLAHDVPTFDARVTGFLCPEGEDGTIHYVRRLVEDGDGPRHRAEHPAAAAKRSRVVPTVTLITCSACKGRLHIRDATAFFRAGRPDPVRFVHRADVASACFRQAVVPAVHASTSAARSRIAA